MNEQSAIWRLSSALHFSYQSQAHGVAGGQVRHLGMPSHQATQGTVPWQRADTETVPVHTTVAAERKKESKREGYTTFPASLPSFLLPPQG